MPPSTTQPPPLLIRGARVVTLARGVRPRRGAALADLAVIESGDVLVEHGLISQVEPAGGIRPAAGVQVIEAGGRVLMPGFVDAHTHACWAGPPDHRLDEWASRMAGTPYLEQLAQGKGIMATVRSVRAASVEGLTSQLAERLGIMLRHGTTTTEVKSGYGLQAEHELKMLRAIHSAASFTPMTIKPTALLGHALDPDHPDGPEAFVEHTVRSTLDRVASEFPGITVDAFCERSAWSIEQTTRLFQAAQSRSLPLRVHADQFTSLGMLQRAVHLGARSVDHLEATTTEDLQALARSPAFGVLLPISGFHLDDRYANGRALVDAGGAVCIATNLNPGSAPCFSMAMVIALAVRKNGLTPAEAIAAATINPAALLGLHDRGTIAPGQRADLILLRHRDERLLASELGGNPVETVIVAGQIVAPV
jgi:imidazolonepropionase